VRIENETVETDSDGRLRVRVMTACEIGTFERANPE
jgi:hypothetical protein